MTAAEILLPRFAPTAGSLGDWSTPVPLSSPTSCTPGCGGDAALDIAATAIVNRRSALLCRNVQASTTADHHHCRARTQQQGADDRDSRHGRTGDRQ